jgi:putative endonuclease
MQLSFDFSCARPTEAARGTPLPCSSDTARRSVRRCRQHRGQVSYLAGKAAEDCVARRYEGRGASVAARRWRGRGGEVDLVLREGTRIIFVEVKRSASFERAAERVTRAQLRRIHLAGAEYLDTLPSGQLTEARLDVALVNSAGEVRVIENAML